MSNHRNQVDRNNIEALRKLLPELPSFCAQFFRGIEPQTTPLTRLNYAGDLRLFFDFLVSEIDRFKGRSIASLTCMDMADVQPVDLEIYLDYLTYYERDGRELENRAHGKERKLSAIRTLFKYLFKREMIPSNVASLVDLPSKPNKPIIRLEPDEVAKMLDLAESGEGLTKRQKAYQQRTRMRDLAMLMLFLSTGIRVSECVGINIEDIDFTSNGFAVTRKGGDRVILYFPQETADALQAYLKERVQINPLPGHEQALFLSLQRRRMNVRSVEKLVERYAQIAAPLKNISPHKLRSTFGTTLYQETGDIYLVADVLGHSDVNTTRKHYAAMSDEKRRMAAQVIKLRDDD